MELEEVMEPKTDGCAPLGLEELGTTFGSSRRESYFWCHEGVIVIDLLLFLVSSVEVLEAAAM